jgi:hypothetical protein
LKSSDTGLNLWLSFRCSSAAFRPLRVDRAGVVTLIRLHTRISTHHGLNELPTRLIAHDSLQTDECVRFRARWFFRAPVALQQGS